MSTKIRFSLPSTMAAIFVLAAATIIPNSSYALVMDFGMDPTTTTPSTPFVQNGLTMTPLNTGSVGGNHWDRYATAPFGTPTDNAAVIHRGNNAEEVEFVFMGGTAFDLLSVRSEGFLLSPANVGGMDATFMSSSGAMHVIHDTDPVGPINFAAMAGWSNITSFKISVPLGVGTCSDNVDCSNFGFDDITFQEHVPPNGIPEPGTLALFGLGLAGLAAARRRKTG